MKKNFKNIAHTRFIAAIALAFVALLVNVSSSPAAEAKLDTAKIEQLTGIKGELSEKEGVFKVTAPRSDLCRRPAPRPRSRSRLMLPLLPAAVRMFVCTKPTDMRNSFDGLVGVVQEFLGQDPLSGHLFLFFNRRRDRAKLLFWDRDGLVIWYKSQEGDYPRP